MTARIARHGWYALAAISRGSLDVSMHHPSTMNAESRGGHDAVSGQARENRAYVRRLLWARQPDFAAALERAVRDLNTGCPACTTGSTRHAIRMSLRCSGYAARAQVPRIPAGRNARHRLVL